MKKSILIFALTSITCLNLFSQEINRRMFDSNAGQEILIDQVDLSGLRQEPFLSWYNEEYGSYIPDEDIIDKLIDIHSENVSIIILLGTWCGDSKREVPRFFRIIDEMVFSHDMIQMIAVNRLKQSEFVNIDELDLLKVPTFIIFRDGKEQGRIIEHPEVSLEKDLYNILSFGE